MGDEQWDEAGGTLVTLAKLHKRAQREEREAANDLAVAITAASDYGMSLAAIGRHTGLCRQRVHQIVRATNSRGGEE